MLVLMRTMARSTEGARGSLVAWGRGPSSATSKARPGRQADDERAPDDDAQGRTFGRHAWITVACMAFALVLGLVALVVEDAIVLRRIRRINEIGGTVYSYAAPLPLWGRWPPKVRAWIQDHYVVRADYAIDFDDAFSDCRAEDPTLMSRRARAADPGDAGLAAVRDLGHVRWLKLANASVSDAGLRDLRDLGALEHLHLGGTQVAGPGLAHLRGLPLRELILWGTPLDDAGLAHLQDLPALVVLDLRGTRVTSAGLVHLVRFRALRDLDLDDTRAGDQGLGSAAGLSVSHLTLDGTAVSDAGLDDLARMPALDFVSLCSTRVTTEAAVRSPGDAIRRWGERRRAMCIRREPPPGP
jgi:hypothetical protein